jgi:hypothetical protein
LAISYFWDRFFLLMKIRISDKGVRFRLSMQDVELLRSVGACTMSLHLANEISMGYSIRVASIPLAVIQQTNGNHLEVCWPVQDITDWFNDSQKEGIYTELNASNGERITIAIEKDFACNAKDEKEHPELFFPRTNSPKKC